MGEEESAKKIAGYNRRQRKKKLQKEKYEMIDLEREGQKDVVRQNERNGKIRSKEQDIVVAKIDIKGERKGVRHTQKKRLREGERESTGKTMRRLKGRL